MSGASPPRWRFLAILFGVAAVTAAAILTLLNLPPGGTPLPDFELVDETGKPFRRSDLDGKVWIADFIFTRCSGPCPAMTSDLGTLRAELPPEVQFVSFTVDPGYDTPAVLARYAENCKAFGPWTFLTGDMAVIRDLAVKRFKVSLQGAADPNAILHSIRYFLVDRRGRVQGTYLALDAATLEPDPEVRRKLIADTDRLVTGLRALPALHAILNGTNALLLLLGFLFIRRKLVAAHLACMVTALAVTAVFLTSYLYYHYHVGSTPFPGTGPVRILYFTILISHTTLAAFVPPLAAVTVWRAYKRTFDRHRQLARWTLPIWMYVSVTGVVVYLMLYQL